MAYCKLFILPVAYSLIAFSGCDQTDRSTGASTPQPSVIDEPPGGPGPPVEPEVTEMPVVTVSSDLRHNHQRSVNVFRVAMGFGSGRVLAIPVQMGEIWADHAGRRWEVQEVEFLGIAEHSAPTIVSNERPAAVAHQLTQFDEAQPRIESSGIGVITEDMPTQKEMEVHMMNEKANATERSPNVFETQLIERMLEDKDSPGPWMARAVDRGEDHYRLLGPIRALGSQCLKCHTDYNSGDALGGFFYVLKEQLPEGMVDMKVTALSGSGVP